MARSRDVGAAAAGEPAITVAGADARTFDIADPAWLPHAYSARDDALTFAYWPRDAQRAAVFLTADAAPPVSAPVPVANLLASAPADTRAPLHFIFHTALCCSTLLARALDIPGAAMGLKEPAIFNTFAPHWRSGSPAPAVVRALALSLDMMARPLSAGETPIVKLGNLCNHLAPALLTVRPQAKALLLHSDLDAYLRALARRGHAGRSFGRMVATHFGAGAAPARSDFEAAAQGWLAQMAIFAELAQGFGGERVRAVKDDALLADSADVLIRLGGFFGLPVDPRQAAAIAGGAAFSSHAKEPTLAFDRQTRMAEHAALGQHHAEEIATAMAWARTFAAESGAPLSLGDTLLS